MQVNEYIKKEIKIGQYTKTRYFFEQELRNLPYIDPLFFIDSYYQKGSHFGFNEKDLQTYCFHELQKKFNKILRIFFKSPNSSLNGFIHKELREYLLFREAAGHNKYSPIAIENEVNKFLIGNSISEIIIKLYNDLKKIKKYITESLEVREISIPSEFNLKEFKNKGWQYGIINFLQKEFKKEFLSQAVHSFILHGSFATQDFIDGWSDLDALAILNDNVFENENYLNKIKKKILKLSLVCYQIDPLAHHQFFILTKFDLNNYSEALFPAVLFNYSVLISGNRTINIKLRNDQYEKIQAVANFNNYFRLKIIKAKYSKNKYQLKNDMSQAMLFSSLMLQVKNIFVYKKYSFERFKKEFPFIDDSVLAEITGYMQNWKILNLFKYYPKICIKLFPYSISKKMVNIHHNINTISNKGDIIKLSKKILLFTECGLNAIIKNQ